VEPSGIGMDLVVEIPILIGTIPNYGRQPAQNSLMTQSMIGSNLEPQLVESIVDGFMDVSVVGQLPAPVTTEAPPSRHTEALYPEVPFHDRESLLLKITTRYSVNKKDGTYFVFE
jgi:hypothetical protein